MTQKTLVGKGGRKEEGVSGNLRPGDNKRKEIGGSLAVSGRKIGEFLFPKDISSFTTGSEVTYRGGVKGREASPTGPPSPEGGGL